MLRDVHSFVNGKIQTPICDVLLDPTGKFSTLVSSGVALQVGPGSGLGRFKQCRTNKQKPHSHWFNLNSDKAIKKITNYVQIISKIKAKQTFT